MSNFAVWTPAKGAKMFQPIGSDDSLLSTETIWPTAASLTLIIKKAKRSSNKVSSRCFFSFAIKNIDYCMY